MSGKKPEALAEFRAYMAHASKTDPRHAEAEEYIAMLDRKD